MDHAGLCHRCHGVVPPALPKGSFAGRLNDSPSLCLLTQALTITCGNGALHSVAGEWVIMIPVCYFSGKLEEIPLLCDATL